MQTATAPAAQTVHPYAVHLTTVRHYTGSRVTRCTYAAALHTNDDAYTLVAKCGHEMHPTVEHAKRCGLALYRRTRAADAARGAAES